MSGLDPHARRLEREAQAAQQNQPQPLDPPFPFQPTAFDPWFFGIENDPPPPVGGSATTSTD